MAGLINLRLLTDFFNKIGQSRSSQFALAHRYDRSHPKADIVSRPALGAHARHAHHRGVRPC